VQAEFVAYSVSMNQEIWNEDCVIWNANQVPMLLALQAPKYLHVDLMTEIQC
jgi:hypothetical protein